MNKTADNRYNIIIAGAGPAGLFCAINASRSGRSVLLLEKNSSAGCKLLLSGSGQCNFTHTGSVAEFTHRYGAASNFVKPALSAFTNTDLINFMESNGIETSAREDGKLFPSSMYARDILSMLLRLCADNGVKIKFNSAVSSVIHSGSGFKVNAGDTEFFSEILVIAAGGSSYPVTGSSGDGFTLAESLGHHLTEITPALTPLYVRDYTLGELAGISVKGSSVTVLREGKKTASGKGDVLFTMKGLSGPVILDLSRYIRSGDTVSVSLTDISAQESESILTEKVRSEGKKSIRNILKNFDIPERLADAVLEHAGVDPAKKGAGITKAERLKLLQMINSFPFTVERKGDFRAAMATAGGVSRDEIDRRTMESRIIKNLYFAGEVIDVDGDTGGYNIQWAFSSGKAAADGILNKN